LCTKGWIHAYPTENVVLALMVNPIHANFKPARAWQAEGCGRSKSADLKIGYEIVTVLREVAIPDITVEQRVRFAICCALQVCKDESFCKWANSWLSGEDRSKRAAAAAAAWAAEESGAKTLAAMWVAAKAATAAKAAAEEAAEEAAEARAVIWAAAWATGAAAEAEVDLELAATFAMEEPWDA
jgi:hypothetical protein